MKWGSRKYSSENVKVFKCRTPRLNDGQCDILVSRDSVRRRVPTLSFACLALVSLVDIGIFLFFLVGEYDPLKLETH